MAAPPNPRRLDPPLPIVHHLSDIVHPPPSIQDPKPKNPKSTPSRPSHLSLNSDLPPPPPPPPTPANPSSDLVSSPVLAPDLVVPIPSGAPSRSAATQRPSPLCQLASSGSCSGNEPPAVLSVRDPSRSELPLQYPLSQALPLPAPQGEIGPQLAQPSEVAQPAQPALAAAAGPLQFGQLYHRGVAAPLSSSPPYGHIQSEAPPSSIAAPLSRPASSIPPRSSAPRQQSYAQVARSSRGPGFVRSHARDVESFARLPRTTLSAAPKRECRLFLLFTKNTQWSRSYMRTHW